MKNQSIKIIKILDLYVSHRTKVMRSVNSRNMDFLFSRIMANPNDPRFWYNVDHTIYYSTQQTKLL